MYRDVGVSLTPRGLRQLARSISRLSPIFSGPVALFAIKIASLILRPDSRLVDVTAFHSVRRPSFSFGSSSLISRRRHCLSVSFLRLRPPGNIQSLSRRRLTRRTRPRFEATSFEDLAIFQRPRIIPDSRQRQHPYGPHDRVGFRRHVHPHAREAISQKAPCRGNASRGLVTFTDMEDCTLPSGESA